MKNSDESIDRALARLREAEVPEGLEGRIAAQLAARAAVRGEARSAVAGVWWWGALSGFALAMVVVGVIWLVGYRGRLPSHEVVVRERVVAAVPPGLAVKEDVRREPCVSSPRVVRDSATARRQELVRIARAEMEMSHPAPAMGLTAQERELVQLARNGDAKDLAALDPEMRAKAEAKDAAEFQRFFAEPVRGEAAPAVPAADNQ